MSVFLSPRLPGPSEKKSWRKISASLVSTVPNVRNLTVTFFSSGRNRRVMEFQPQNPFFTKGKKALSPLEEQKTHNDRRRDDFHNSSGPDSDFLSCPDLYDRPSPRNAAGRKKSSLRRRNNHHLNKLTSSPARRASRIRRSRPHTPSTGSSTAKRREVTTAA